MTLLALIPGIALPALVGWLLLDLLEWNARVLGHGEKWVLGWVLGLTFSMFCAFFANVLLGVPFTLLGFIGIFCVLLIVLGAPWFIRKRTAEQKETIPAPRPVPRAVKIVLGILGGWVLLRVIALTVLLLATPPFFDDTMDNWNLRGKLFFLQKTFTLEFPWGVAPGVSSYPPSLPLTKTWLSTIAGTWNEGLVNSVHALWFAALLLLVFWTLRRMLQWPWAALGTILLASLPLELIQGTNAYGDVFLSVHLFAAVMLLLQALRSRSPEGVRSYLRLSALAIALVPFTKNEGWALYFPVLLLLFGASLLWLWRTKRVTQRNMLLTLAFAGVMIVALVAPWIGFKVGNGLAFGNAKGIDWHLKWQSGVAFSIMVNTFLEGNWGLLFPLFFGLLAVRWRTAFRTPFVLLTSLFLIPYLGQLFAYLTTGLSQEALFQTGYARGLIHLMPVIVTLTVLLLHDLLSGKPDSLRDS